MLIGNYQNLKVTEIFQDKIEQHRIQATRRDVWRRTAQAARDALGGDADDDTGGDEDDVGDDDEGGDALRASQDGDDEGLESTGASTAVREIEGAVRHRRHGRRSNGGRGAGAGVGDEEGDVDMRDAVSEDGISSERGAGRAARPLAPVAPSQRRRVSGRTRAGPARRYEDFIMEPNRRRGSELTLAASSSSSNKAKKRKSN